MESFERLLQNESMPLGFWIAIEDAYKSKNYLVTPFSSTFEWAYEDGFNFLELFKNDYLGGFWHSKQKIGNYMETTRVFL